MNDEMIKRINGCDCGHLKSYHLTADGCSGTVLKQSAAIRDFKPCPCTGYSEHSSRVDEIEARERVLESIAKQQGGGGWNVIESVSELPTEDCIVTLVNRAGELKVKITKSGNVWNGLRPTAWMPLPEPFTPAEQGEK